MLVIVAGCSDGGARELAKRWAPWDASVLTCEDLAAPGWRYRPDAPGRTRMVVDGNTVAAGQITGVLTRLPHVREDDLRHRIAREDRAYAAAEMTALLRSWLSGLPCPVLNRPTPTCLSAPGWRREQAVFVAAGLGIPSTPVSWRLDPDSDATDEQPPASSGVTVTVIGSRCLGTTDAGLAVQARRLASSASVDLLAARFVVTGAGYELHGADPWADTSSPEIADAILNHLRTAGIS